MRRDTLRVALTAALLLTACGGGKSEVLKIDSLRFIGEQRLAPALDYQGTTVGGLSSLDYDAATGAWYVISDDRSEKQPVRVYTARLAYDERAFQPVQLTGVVSLKQPDGALYPSVSQDASRSPDPEGLRWDAASGTLWWTSEGDRARQVNPFVRQVKPDGTHVAELPLPALFQVSTTEVGPRQNGVFEGLTFSPDGKTLYVSLEEPLYQDGPRADLVETRSPIRIATFERATGNAGPQYAYLLDKVAAQSQPSTAFRVNGVVEVLSVDTRRLLVLERSFSVGVGNTVKLYEVDLAGATDVSGLSALAEASFTPVNKRLLLDFATLRLETVDNIEGMAWGPPLGNGHRSLVFVSDDNFDSNQVTQFLAFEVLPQP